MLQTNRQKVVMLKSRGAEVHTLTQRVDRRQNEWLFIYDSITKVSLPPKARIRGIDSLIHFFIESMN
ncbi:MAG TPA: hypothetical protein VK388_15295, partial [Pyrinomonadaceae bacterium]|nr:hypothetical protein [Pyrinomonadaceae bacterium]